MAIIQSGVTQSALLGVDPTFKAIKTTNYPQQLLGSYSVGARTGSLNSATPLGPLWTFKYTGPGVCVIRRLAVNLQVITAFTQGSFRVGAYFVRGVYTQGTTNTTLVNTYQQTGAKRTSMPTPNVRIYAATTVAILTDSTTGTVDTHPFGMFNCDLPNQITCVPRTGMYNIYDSLHQGTYPLVLVENDGIRLQHETLMAITGVAALIVQCEWDEMTSY